LRRITLEATLILAPFIRSCRTTSNWPFSRANKINPWFSILNFAHRIRRVASLLLHAHSMRHGIRGSTLYRLPCSPLCPRSPGASAQQVQIRASLPTITASVFISPASLNFTGVFTQPLLKSEMLFSDIFPLTLVIQYWVMLKSIDNTLQS
jgi:hypothetical protein